MSNTTTTSLPLAQGLWALDKNHSSVGFTIRHLGVSKVRGHFARFDAELFVGSTLDDSYVTATIDVSSIDTANPDRDAHVLSPDLIDVARRPVMSFRSNRITGDGSDWTVDGDLTIGDVTKPFKLNVDFGGIESFPMGGPRHAGFEARGELKRKEYGIDMALPPGVGVVALGDVIKVELDIQLLEPGDA